jgi:hypothetical protein
VGEVADLVKSAIAERLNLRLALDIKHVQDVRNYKVNIEKAANVLSFHPQEDVKSIVCGLLDNLEKFSDWENPEYSNIRAFRNIEKDFELPVMVRKI